MRKFKRPLILAGQGIRLANRADEFIDFAEKINYPVVTSKLGMDLIPTDHPLYVGRAGNHGTKAGNLALDNADFLLILGCRLAGPIIGYHPEKWAKNAYKVMVDIDSEELKKPDVKIDKSILMDLKNVFQYNVSFKGNKKWQQQCLKWRKENPIVTKEMRKQKLINSYYFIETLSKLVTAEDTILVDTGACFHTVAQAWKVKKGQRILITGGLSSMGWWAASLGCGIMGNTICITGDGSLQMNLQELATVKHYNLPIKIFVFNNQGYGLIRATQKRFFGKDNLIGESPKTGVWCPPLRKIAKAYGLSWTLIDNIRNMWLANFILNRTEPGICEVVVPKWEKLVRNE